MMAAIPLVFAAAIASVAGNMQSCTPRLCLPPRATCLLPEGAWRCGRSLVALLLSFCCFAVRVAHGFYLIVMVGAFVAPQVDGSCSATTCTLTWLAADHVADVDSYEVYDQRGIRLCATGDLSCTIVGGSVDNVLYECVTYSFFVRAVYTAASARPHVDTPAAQVLIASTGLFVFLFLFGIGWHRTPC